RGELGKIGVGAEHVEEAVLALDHRWRAGEAVAGEPRGHDAAFRCAAGMQALHNPSRERELEYPGAEGAGDAEGVRHAPGVEAHQLPRGQRAAEGAEEARGMEPLLLA